MKKSKVEETTTPDTINYVNVQSLLESRIEYTGKVSQRQYIWPKAGSIVSVLPEDAPELLQKTFGRKRCCGEGYNKIFQLA